MLSVTMCTLAMPLWQIIKKPHNMARVLFGDIVVDMRNKSGGHVYAKNRSGNYKRTKVTPVNPQTTAQQAQRQLFGSYSAGWRGLTAAQRLSWINAAPSFPVTNIFGQSMTLTGANLYVAFNKNLINAGGAAITSAPSPVAIPTLSINTLVADNSSALLTLLINTATVPTGFALMVFATPLIGPGQYFVKNKYRMLGVFSATANLVTLSSAWIAKNGTLTVGQKVFVKCFLVSTVTGQAGVPVSLDTTVVV